jgi:NADPH:quinone reductase-like Zn-dependent oxidoreductase
VRQVVAERAGGPDELRVVDAPVPEPGPDEVLIAAEAVGVNFADVWARLGVEGEPPYRPGIEVAGTVTAVGVDVSAVSVGDRVAAIPYATGGAYAELVRAPADLCFPLPAGMPATEGAALPLNYLTAYAAVEHAARPRQGERVLVHAGAGGVGLAAVQLARRHGVELYATASPGKHEVLREEGVDHPFGYADWVGQVRETSGGGVDVVVDGVGEDRFRRSLSVLGFGGRVVAYRYTTGVTGETDADHDLETTLSAGVPLYELLSDARGIVGVHLAAPTATLRRWWDHLLALHASGEIAPRVTTLPLADAAEAHRRLHARENVGKLVLVP